MSDLHIHLEGCEVAINLGYEQATQSYSGTLPIFSASKSEALPEVEIRVLCNGKRVSVEEADRAVAALGDGWRLETPHELFGCVDHRHKNANGAYTRDETIQDGPYWTNEPAPWLAEGRFVVLFDGGSVGGYSRNGTAFARAVRVPSQ